MKKITEKEENEMYRIINDALFALCENKPNNPVEYLSKKMLELIGEDTEIFRSKKTVKPSKAQINDEINVNVKKLVSMNLVRKFSDNYKVLRRIGVGAHGEVFLVEDLKLEDQPKVAKIIDKTDEDPHTLTENTIQILLSLDHPNIVKIYEIFEDEKHLYIIQEYCQGGDLFNFIVEKNIMTENLVKVIIKQILDALNYLHQKDIVHRDIKPENILIMSKEFTSIHDLTIKLSDFMSSILLGKKKRKTGKVVGSPYYLAPEVIEGKFDYKCDLWSLGIVGYTMLAGVPPFSGKEYEVLYKILHEDFEFSPYQSEICRDFLANLINKNSRQRFSVREALEHPWMELDENTENKDQLGVEILKNMSKFVLGKNLRRSVLSYILSKKLYVDNNNDLMKMFKEIDKDGNGQISVEELYEKYGKFFPGTPQEVWEKVKVFVERVDINNNGSLEYSEFLTITSLINTEVNQKMLRDVFKFYDQSGEGTIDANDLKEIFEDTDLTDEDFQNMIDEYDLNGDRKISFDEFYQMILKNF